MYLSSADFFPIGSLMVKIEVSKFIAILAFVIFQSCSSDEVTPEELLVDTQGPTDAAISPSTESFSITSVALIDGNLVVTGTNLNLISAVSIEDTHSSTQLDMTLLTQTESEVLLQPSAAFEVIIGSIYNLLINTADAQSATPLTFRIDDNTIPASKLERGAALHGQVLSFDEVEGVWLPTTPESPSALTVADASITTSKIVDESITTSKLGTGSVAAVNLNQMGASNGQVLQYSTATNAWSPVSLAADTNTLTAIYSAMETNPSGLTNNAIFTIGELQNASFSGVGGIGVPKDGNFTNLCVTHWGATIAAGAQVRVIISVNNDTTTSLGNGLELTFTNADGTSSTKCVEGSFPITASTPFAFKVIEENGTVVNGGGNVRVNCAATFQY
jgi:hypothetical protein